MKQEMGSILQLLLPLARDPSNSERSEEADRWDDLQMMLQQLKGVAVTLTQTARTQVSSSLEQTHQAHYGGLKNTADIGHLKTSAFLTTGIIYLCLFQDENLCLEK